MHLILIALLSTFTGDATPPLISGPVGGANSAQCESPLGWRVGELDPAFGLTREEATDAIRRAAMMWGEALEGRLLFREESVEESGSIDIRFVAGEERRAALARRERDQALLAESDRIASLRAAIDSVRLEVDQFRTTQEESNRLYLDRMSEYNRMVNALNSAGGVSPQMDARLSEMATALDQEKAQLDVLTAEFNAMVDALNARTRQLNLEVTAYNQELASDQAASQGEQVLSAAYRETRRELGPLTAFVSRTIEVYDFDGRNDLILILAREMGRALGLEVTSIPGAVMSGTAPREGTPSLHPSDVEAVRALCSAR